MLRICSIESEENIMKLKDIEVQRSKVYVIANGHTYCYESDILARFGGYQVNGLSIINGIVYITVNLFVINKTGWNHC